MTTYAKWSGTFLILRRLRARIKTRSDKTRTCHQVPSRSLTGDPPSLELFVTSKSEATGFEGPWACRPKCAKCHPRSSSRTRHNGPLFPRSQERCAPDRSRVPAVTAAHRQRALALRAHNCPPRHEHGGRRRHLCDGHLLRASARGRGGGRRPSCREGARLRRCCVIL